MPKAKVIKNDGRIAGVQFNINSTDLRNVKSMEDLQKLEIFNHLSTEEKGKAEKELYDQITGKKVGPVGTSAAVPGAAKVETAKVMGIPDGKIPPPVDPAK